MSADREPFQLIERQGIAFSLLVALNPGGPMTTRSSTRAYRNEADLARERESLDVAVAMKGWRRWSREMQAALDRHVDRLPDPAPRSTESPPRGRR